MGDELHEDKSAAQTLDRIRAGGQSLIMNAHQRMAEARESLLAGDFRATLGHLNEAESALSPLAHAQVYIGVADEATIVRAADLEQGMTLAEVGEITSIESTTCVAHRCAGHVKLTVGEHEMNLTGDTEVFVTEAPAPSEE